jgi:hypothetical protein
MVFVSNDQLLKVSKVIASVLSSFCIILLAVYIFFAIKEPPETARSALSFVQYAWPFVGIVVAVNAVLIFDVLSILLWRLGIHREDVQFRRKYHPYEQDDVRYKKGWFGYDHKKWEREYLMAPYAPSTDKYFAYPLIFVLSLIVLFSWGGNLYDRNSTTTNNLEMFRGDAPFRDVANAG